MNSRNVTSLGENLMQAIVFFSVPLVQTVAIAVTGAALAAFLFLQFREKSRTERNDEPATLTGLRVLAVLLAPIWLLIVGYILQFLGALAMDFDVTLYNTKDGSELRWHVLGFVGLITALGALVSAPLALIRVWTTERQTRTSEQGHMTDRISKAVEQLGAEKDISRPMRNVTFIFKDNDGKEIKGETVLLGKDDPLPPLSAGGRFCYGDWQINKRTVPNIEVRIGGLLSLERIAQDSTRYDKGRDHVRVMEILCAYVRENAPASGAKKSFRELWEAKRKGRGPDDPLMDEDQFAREVVGNSSVDFNYYVSVEATKKWAQSLQPPRADISLALRVIGRRDASQRQVEARWGPAASEKAEWIFDKANPETQALLGIKGRNAREIENYQLWLRNFRKEISEYRGYRLDLRETNLQRVDMTQLILSGARLDGARLDGSILTESRMEGVSLASASICGVSAHGIRMNFSKIKSTKIEGTSLTEARLNGAKIEDSFLDETDLRASQINGSNLANTSLRNASLHWAGIIGSTLFAIDARSANFIESNFQGSRLAEAQFFESDFQNANLSGVEFFESWFSKSTNFEGADLSFSGFRDVSLLDVNLKKDQIFLSFGDGSVFLPKNMERPAHWPNFLLESIGEPNYYSLWRKWQDDPERYVPPSPPE